MEHRYTSTGIKWWRHVEQMENYRAGRPGTIISTHVAPEGACNLSCPYCSVTHRDTHSRIEFPVIERYLRDLRSAGLRAVIFTGGGEPTAYKQFNELVRMASDDLGLRCALITNGTLTQRVDPDVWATFDWVRVSVNFFPNWEERIGLPVEQLRDDCVVGLSTVFTDKHESAEELERGWGTLYESVSKIADRTHARYVRVLPDCLLAQDDLVARHKQLDDVLEGTGDARFFHQFKIHGAPDAGVCHQAYFRPYLSEEKNPWDGEPGTVFPCDSVVLNAPAPDTRGFGKFIDKYAVCKPGDILKFLDGTIRQSFVPREDCHGCVFTRNVEMLRDWKEHGIGEFTSEPLEHEDFV